MYTKTQNNFVFLKLMMTFAHNGKQLFYIKSQCIKENLE